MRFVALVGFVLVVVLVVSHAHHFSEFLEGKHAVAILVKGSNDVVAGWHVRAIVLHGLNVLDEMFQFLEGKPTAVVSVGFVEHRHQQFHHVIFHDFIKR